jgi:hypothetical protein
VVKIELSDVTKISDAANLMQCKCTKEEYSNDNFSSVGRNLFYPCSSFTSDVRRSVGVIERWSYGSAHTHDSTMMWNL